MNIPCENCNHKNVCENTFDPYYYSECEYYEEPRPHGTWNDHSDEGYVECPFCDHATNCDDNIEELHFCFFCGAELKKGCDTNDQL